MIHLQNISLAFAGQTVFRDLDWFIRSGKRIGLIGPNGAGKTTLLRLINGNLRPDTGTISMASDLSVGFLEQGVQEFDPDRSVLEEAKLAFAPLLALEQEIEDLTSAIEAEDDYTSDAYRKMLHRLELLHTRLSTHDAHRIDDKSAAVLTGLGFEPDELDQPLRTFSGGWRMRTVLAKILLQEPDILLLDEPTNHLDIESIDWLEEYLKSYAGTVILVSHDRYFLDRIVTVTAELAHGKVTEYAGNFAFYLTERVARREIQQAEHDNQQIWIRDTERFIERFRYKASKARQVQSRVKALERLELIPPPPSESAAIHFRFPDPPRSGRTVLELSTFSKQYDRPEGGIITVFQDAGPLHIERGDKIALVGKNGAGKSTLARILRGSEPFDGTRTLGYHTTLTYFAQHQAEALDINRSILEVVSEHAPGQSETQVRSLLGAFLFHGDDVYKQIGVLSGGERSRVALAATLLEPANLLILDEPTNHLDIASINVLIEALRQFTGTFVVVSHDRHFLDQVVNRVWYVSHGSLVDYPGTYSEFNWKMKDDHRLKDSSIVPTPESTEEVSLDASPGGGKKTKEQKRAEAEARQAIADQLKLADEDFDSIEWDSADRLLVQKVFEKVEKEIAQKEAEKTELETRLADPSFYADTSNYSTTLSRFETIETHLTNLYHRWERLAEQI